METWVEALRFLVKTMVEALVDQPEKVRVNPVQGEKHLVLELFVAPEDLGKVIGREGRNADALRTIARGAGGKLRKRVELEIATHS